MASVLLIEDEPILAGNICELLSLAGHRVASEGGGLDGLGAAARCLPDVILLDFKLPDIDGFEVMSRLDAAGCRAAIIMMTAHGNVEMAVRAMQSGATDFLTKPLNLEELQMVVERALAHHQARRQLEYFRDREAEVASTAGIVGGSKQITAVKRMIERITSSPALNAEHPPSVLITGETGTGKDLIAQSIHYQGPRSGGQFVLINCTSLPEQLIESELFGHTKGAFTDARSERRGLFEVADGGTVFLDEIGHMQLSTQAKLLSVLEQRTFRPVGATREKKTNVHVIAATNLDLEQAVEAGTFRSDLYHRLRTVSIHMPPLRERRGDIMPLALYFLKLNAGRFGIQVTDFSEQAEQKLGTYEWPGNVRELAHTIENAVLMSESPSIEVEGLCIDQPGASGPASDAHTITVDFDGHPMTLEEFESEVIQAALRVTHNNYSQAGRILGISRDAVRYRLEKRT